VTRANHHTGNYLCSDRRHIQDILDGRPMPCASCDCRPRITQRDKYGHEWAFRRVLREGAWRWEEEIPQSQESASSRPQGHGGEP
jgi:hypothetical protein